MNAGIRMYEMEMHEAEVCKAEVRKKIAEDLPSKAVIAVIKGYRMCVSPLLLPGKCRFIPSCSEYFIQAVEKYGAARGSLLGIRRILKCHPFHAGGYDPLK